MAGKKRLTKSQLIELTDYEYTECRAMGHAWHHRKNAVGVDGPEDQYSRPYTRPFSAGTGMVGKLSQCTSCKGVRIKWITRSGETVNRYYMPEGYSRQGEEDKPSAREWRSTYVESVFKDFTQIDPQAQGGAA